VGSDYFLRIHFQSLTQYEHLIPFDALQPLRLRRINQSLSYSRMSQHFMELRSSLPCSQEPFTGPYPEPDKSSPYHSTPSKIVNDPALCRLLTLHVPNLFHFPSFRTLQIIYPSPRPCVTFRKKLFCLRWGVVSSTLSPPS
jgi:hypothetical protein